ncbi:Hypothetical predicted protein [Olea europaea subsp. europaea]|uniref:Uncharacterized protein n=1 Tax=Olea europaea subsp. europaea TaxID=158383 RepID=A0A8S0SSI9_OLEEU|nr:Hypothetical predicted protein [Olea europaea subsp. europaea]
MSVPSSAGSIRLGPIREEDSPTNVPESNVPQEGNSMPSAYFRSYSKMNDEDVDEEDPSFTISEPADE